MIKTIMGFTPRQMAVMVVMLAAVASGAIWVENRYAKIKEIDEKFQQSEQMLRSSHFLSLEIFSTLPEKQRQQILEKIILSQTKSDNQKK